VLIGTGTLNPVWLELVKLVGFAAVLMPVAIGALAIAVRFSHRRGTILEY
jgi:hypothetical protein